MQLTQALPKQKLLAALMVITLTIVGMVITFSTIQAATATGVNDTHRVHLMKPEFPLPRYEVVIVRSSAYTHAIKESIEEPGGVGGYELKMYYHTNHAAIDNMANCGHDTARYPFCLRFGPNILTIYQPAGEDLPLGFAQNIACVEDLDAWYYCKKSHAVYSSHDLQIEAVGSRSVIITTGSPSWSIILHGGAQVLENTEYVVHDDN